MKYIDIPKQWSLMRFIPSVDPSRDDIFFFLVDESAIKDKESVYTEKNNDMDLDTAPVEIQQLRSPEHDDVIGYIINPIHKNIECVRKTPTFMAFGSPIEDDIKYDDTKNIRGLNGIQIYIFKESIILISQSASRYIDDIENLF